jgi:hypothetical protein
MKQAGLVGLLMFIEVVACAQASKAIRDKHDTSFYATYPNKITGRFFFSQKYTRLSYRQKNEGYSLDYRPNTNLNVGFGATYRWATLNLAYGFDFLNPDTEKGKTHHIDLQFHGYGTKIQIDGFAQFYRGFFLPKGLATAAGGYYQRPDIRVNELGASVQYIVNHTQFSFRSTYLLNDWQKKSAGSWLFGFEVYAGRVKADSALVPRVLQKGDGSQQETFRSYFELGPNVGYAYTWVFREHFFVTGALSQSLDYGVGTSESASGKTWNNGFSSNTFARFVIGYNSLNNGVSFIFLNNSVRLTAPQNRYLTVNTGNFRLTYTHRFTPGRKEKKILDVIK